MPRSAKRIQKVTNVFEEARLSIVKGRKADQPDLWEAEMRLGSPAKRHYRKLNATDEQRAGAEAYKVFCKLDQRAAAGVPISGPTFAKLEPLYRAALDKKIAQLREDVKARPIIAEAKIAGTPEKNFRTFKSRLLPFFGKLPIRGISQQDLARFVGTLKGRGGGTPKVTTIKALNGIFRDAMKCGIAEGWITTEAIPKLPVHGHGRSAPRPAFAANEWQKALAGMTDRWVATGLTAEDDQRNAALSPMERYVPRRRSASVENRRIARAYAVILGASQARPGTEFDYIRPCDLRLNEPDPEAATPAIHLTLPFGKKGATRVVRIRGTDADAVRAAIADLRAANPAITSVTPLFSRKSDQRVLSPLDTLQTYLARRGLLLDPSEGTKRSRYSVRHTAITQRVAHGVNSAVVAVEAGTSLKMMEEFYVARKHIIGGMARDPLTPPELRPLVVSPYSQAASKRLVASQDGQVHVIPSVVSDDNRVRSVRSLARAPRLDMPWSVPAELSGQAVPMEVAADKLAPHAESGGDPDTPQPGSQPDRRPGREGCPHARDTFVLDRWTPEPLSAPSSPFAPSGRGLLMQTTAHRVEGVESGGDHRKAIRVADGNHRDSRAPQEAEGS